ncbi:hypothetical protein BDB01DRAFT_452971 [Pilobolus umbonatus]|nr:hypothetical protein BDB01DRAFT_452971 [Pilobolus umbonatus]
MFCDHPIRRLPFSYTVELLQIVNIEETIPGLLSSLILKLKLIQSMKDLPLEIIGLIVQHVNRDDYYHCLLVSKFWFLVFQRLLYKEVKPLETQQLHLFLESLTLYPRCMEAGAYVKQLDMSLLSGADKFKINSSKEIGFVDALKHCPNLETLSIYSTHEVIQSMKDPRIPGLKKLVVFSLDPLNRQYI